MIRQGLAFFPAQYNKQLTVIKMAFLYFHHREFLKGYVEGRLAISVKTALLLMKQGEANIDSDAIADVTELPIDAIQALEQLPDEYLSDIEDYAKILDVNSEMLSEWYDKMWIEGLRSCAHSFFKKRFYPLPSWARERLDEADEQDLAHWLREGDRYKNLEALLLGYDMADQVLMHEPEHWETKAFLKGMRRSIRIQVIGKFSDVPFWFDKYIAEAGYYDLSGIADRILHAEKLPDLIQNAVVD